MTWTEDLASLSTGTIFELRDAAARLVCAELLELGEPDTSDLAGTMLGKYREYKAEVDRRAGLA
jgi:hypothetical protein